ncbi:MAG: ABC transporter permease [Pseudomonadota bacterium]
MLLRDLRERSVRVVLVSLVIAVATVASINLFSGHLQRVLVTSSSAFLAADRQLDSENGEPIDPAWFEQAQSLGLETAHMVRFYTMLYPVESDPEAAAYQMVSVKAVSPGYPLRGEVEFQSDLSAEVERIVGGPERGEIWLNRRLFALLGLSVGERVEVGNLQLTVSGVLVREPDAGFGFSSLNPRVLMHADDVEATGAVRQGSRVEFIGLFAGEESALEDYYTWLEPRMGPSHEWDSIREGQTLSDSLARAERFLLLGGSLAVLLAAVAVAVASRQYALGQRDAVALLKTLGQTGRRIRQLYRRRLLAWGVSAAVAGLALALPIYWGLAQLANRMMDRTVAMSPDWLGLWPAVLTALVALFAFAYPPLARLQAVPAMRVLRSSTAEHSEGVGRDIALGLLALLGLLWAYAGQIELVLALFAGLALLLLALGLVGWGIVVTLRRVSGGASAWRLALVSLFRHRRASLAQLTVFALVLTLASVLYLVRSSLLADWQMQLPDDAPNHFLINIAPEQLDPVEAFLDEHAAGDDIVLYPMVRGRLTELNGEPVKEAASKEREVEALNRELNLTWMADLPADNEILEGQWWPELGDEASGGVSVESQLAERLELALGDQLTFTIGAEKIDVTVTSIRSLQWDSMKPNFYMAFAPDGALTNMPATWITSFYLPESRKNVLNDFARRFPTISVLEMDHLIDNVRDIVVQVSRAVEAILAMVLAAALAVMAAVVTATLSERQREGALLRTLGAQQSLMVRSTLLEFAILGLLAGVLAVVAAEGAVYALQYRMFEGTFRWHWPLTLILPPLSAALLALMGRWQLGTVLTVSPMRLLRRLE